MKFANFFEMWSAQKFQKQMTLIRGISLGSIDREQICEKMKRKKKRKKERKKEMRERERERERKR